MYKSLLFSIGSLALIVICGSIFFLHEEPASLAAPPPVPAAAANILAVPIPFEPSEHLGQPAQFPTEPEPVRAIPSPPGMPQANAAALENQFRTTRLTEDRVNLAAEIAGLNNAEAVQSIGRLFQFERHPKVKMALLTGLADISQEIDEQGRRAILGSALQGQPKDIRTAALDELAQLDDPQSLAMIRRAMTQDPDKEVRETAAALYQARAGDLSMKSRKSQ